MNASRVGPGFETDCYFDFRTVLDDMKRFILFKTFVCAQEGVISAAKATFHMAASFQERKAKGEKRFGRHG